MNYQPGAARHSKLTPREWQILKLIASGETNDQVCQRLAIAPKTLENHISSIDAKLGVANARQAVAWYHERIAALGPASDNRPVIAAGQFAAYTSQIRQAKGENPGDEPWRGWLDVGRGFASDVDLQRAVLAGMVALESSSRPAVKARVFAELSHWMRDLNTLDLSWDYTEQALTELGRLGVANVSPERAQPIVFDTELCHPLDWDQDALVAYQEIVLSRVRLFCVR